MWFKTVITWFIVLALGVLAVAQQGAQERSLPEELTESEAQTISKEQRPKPHVDAALKVSDARLLNAYKQAQSSQYRAAAQELDVYATVLSYADRYTRRLPSSEQKERNKCLKQIEQTIFKQSRTLEAVTRDLPHDFHETSERVAETVKRIRLRAINDVLGQGEIIKSSDERNQ